MASELTPTLLPRVPATVESHYSTPLPSDAPSSPVTVWSDGDRDRVPSAEFVSGAVASLMQLVSNGDSSCNRSTKPDTQANLRATLMELVDSNVLSAHVLTCATSLVKRLSAVAPKSLNSVTAKRVTVAAVVLAAKAESDEIFALSVYAEVSGVTPSLIKATEAQIFERLQYDVATSAPAFHAALADIVLPSPELPLPAEDLGYF